MRIDTQVIIGRRRAEQARLVERAERFATDLEPGLGIRAVVVFGSVARGDFNVWSDVDVLVVADELPVAALDRLRALGPPRARVHPVAWTAAEFRNALTKSNPIAVEAAGRGIWLRGAPDTFGHG